tara:strand:- start:614 stop:2635 length:2022 start_codon:yes stop_codon:yes gene_type:complete
MKTSKKNLITEINRIHQLMGVKKLITESRKILVPLLQIAQEIVEYAAKRNLDDATRRAVSELKTGTKGLVDADGNPIPLKAEDYVRIFDNLKKSTDTGIIAKMAEIDQKIVSAIQDNISELITPDIKTLIKQYIDSGANEDFVVKELQTIFKNTSYGKYADFTTVVDDAGRAVETLLDDYLREIRKVYVDLGGKLDDVVDGGGGGGSIAREIVEISPVFTRFTNEIGNKMKPLLDEVMELIELRTSTEVDPTRLPELDKEIKTLMERINDINSEFVESLEAQIEYGMTFGPVEDRARWTDINKYITDVKDKYGVWGVTKVSTPRTEFWSWAFETWEASLTFEKSIGKFFRGIWNWKQNLAEAWTKGVEAAKKGEGIREKITAYERDVNSDLAAKVPFWQKHIWPGSSRGLPKPIEGKDGTDLVYPNAYGELLKYQTKNKMVRAYLSLVAEKLLIVGKSQLYYSVIIPAVRLYQFVKADWGDYGVEKKYGSCITETSQAIKDGEINWDDSDFQSMTEEEKTNFFSQFPPCLQTLLQSEEFFNNEFEDFMTRAEFWSRGRREQAVASYFIESLLDLNVYDPLRLITGTFGNMFIKFFPGLREAFWEAEETGNMSALEQFLEEQPAQIVRDTTEVDNEADTLLLNMTDRDIEEAVRVLDSLSQNTDIELVPLPSRN